MNTGHAHTVWVEQCRAATTIKARFGLQAAFDYLVAEKLMNFAEAARERPVFARELPGFVAEVRRIFAPQDLQEQLRRLEREQAVDAADRARAAEDGDLEDDFVDPPALVAARQESFGIMKQVLLEAHLGTS